MIKLNRTLGLLTLAVAVVMVGCEDEPNIDFDLTDAHVIDTRQRLHWGFAHVEGARHIDWDCIVIGMRHLGIEEHEPIVIYDQNESLARRAEVSLRNMSYLYVRNAGGLQDVQQLLDRPIVSPEDSTPTEVEQAIMAECEERRALRPEL